MSRLRTWLAQKIAPWYPRHVAMLERVAIPALQDDKKVAVDALLAIERTCPPAPAWFLVREALDRLEVTRAAPGDSL